MLLEYEVGLDKLLDLQGRNSSKIRCENYSLNGNNKHQETKQTQLQIVDQMDDTTTSPSSLSFVKTRRDENNEITSSRSKDILENQKNSDNKLHTSESFPDLLGFKSTTDHYPSSVLNTRNHSSATRTTLPPILSSSNSTMHRSQSFPQMSSIDDNREDQEKTHWNHLKQTEQFDQFVESNSRATSVLEFDAENNIMDDQVNITKNWNLFCKVIISCSTQLKILRRVALDIKQCQLVREDKLTLYYNYNFRFAKNVLC